MDPITLAELRTSVRGLLTDDAYDETLIDEALNWVVFDLFSSYRLRMAEANETLTGSIGDVTLAWPSDMLTRLELYLTSPTKADMKRYFVEYGDFMANYSDFATATPNRLTYWTDYGKTARFSAPLSVEHTFAIDYLRMPEPMSADSDECEIPRIYSELVSKLGLARIMEINEDYAEAQQERDNASPLLTTFVRNEGRGGGKTGPGRVRTNRGRVGGYRADRDF